MLDGIHSDTEVSVDVHLSMPLNANVYVLFNYKICLKLFQETKIFKKNPPSLYKICNCKKNAIHLMYAQGKNTRNEPD